MRQLFDYSSRGYLLLDRLKLCSLKWRILSRYIRLYIRKKWNWKLKSRYWLWMIRRDRSILAKGLSEADEIEVSASCWCLGSPGQNCWTGTGCNYIRCEMPKWTPAVFKKMMPQYPLPVVMVSSTPRRSNHNSGSTGSRSHWLVSKPDGTEGVCRNDSNSLKSDHCQQSWCQSSESSERSGSGKTKKAL